MMEVVRETRKLYEQKDVVKAVEQRFKTKVISGVGKEAVTEEVPDGWWITFVNSRTAIRIENKPDVKPGDVATCTWEFSRGQG